MSLIGSPIYKIHNVTKENKIKQIWVFYGFHLDVKDMNFLQKKFKQNPNDELFIDKSTQLPIFSEKELEKIQKENSEVIFLNEIIHPDDNIGTIKLKLAYMVKLSVEEIHLFCLKKEKIYTENVYKILSQDDNLEITKARLEQFLLNIVNHDNGEPFVIKIPDKSTYSYNDILALDLNEHDFQVSKILGQKLVLVDNEYPCIANPFLVREYDPLIERVSRKSLTTLNSHLLLNTGHIIDRNIYLCLAQEAVEYSSVNNISEETTIKVYYPFLYNEHIISLEELKGKSSTLVENTRKKVTEGVLLNFKNVDMFYDIYKNRKTNLDYKTVGIKQIKLVIHPVFSIKIPLDTLFKLVHSTEDVPLIKYNPSKKQENLYRLYTYSSSKKIPYLQPSSILKGARVIGKRKSVSFYISNTELNVDVFCEVEENGAITVSTEFVTPLDLLEVNRIIKESVNSVILQILEIFSQNEHTMTLFKDLTDDNIEIKNIQYDIIMIVKKKMLINNYKGCIKSVFNIETIKNDEFHLRFKRVSNFNKKNSYEAFIIEKQKQGVSRKEIVKTMIENFEDVTQLQADEMIDKIINELQMEKNAKTKMVEIKIHPGFKVVILVNKIQSELKISISGINDIAYIEILPIYIDSLIRIMENKASTKYSTTTINKLCSNKQVEEVIIEDIISVSELALPYNETAYIESGDFGFKETDKTDNGIQNILDFIYGEDEEDEDVNDSDIDVIVEEETVKKREITGGMESLESSQDSIELSPQYPITPVLSKQDNSQQKDIDVGEVDREVDEEVDVDYPVENENDNENNIHDESSEDEEDEEELKRNTLKDITGMNLTYPNYFQTKLEKRAPFLFLSEKTKNINSYSRLCQYNTKRQPVILNQKELDKINKENPGYLEKGDVLKYGTNSKDEYYYVCPRYWCLLTDSLITEEDVKKGKCGGVIPQDSKVVPKGYYVFEFLGKDHGSSENYKKHYPGFHKNTTSEGHCIPCCFKKWDTPEQISRRQKCSKNIVEKKNENIDIQQPENTIINDEQIQPIVNEKSKEEKAEEPEKLKTAKKNKKQEGIVNVNVFDYIIGPEKFPLEENRWGYLPFSIQKFFNHLNINCQISPSKPKLKSQYTCFLRHGVENNENQSFIACIADALFFLSNIVPSIKEMKNIIINAIDLDSFTLYQNGNLMLDFSESFSYEKTQSSINIEKYYTTKTYKRLKTNQDELLYKIIFAYENFISFLSNDNVVIDHTHLWDIVCKQNKNLFKTGLNLLIFEIPDNDLTNNVELLCPTNHYASSFYEPRSPNLILIKRGNYFEPMYSYREENKILISKVFSEYDRNILPSMKNIIQKIIKPVLKTMCTPLESMPSIYKYKQPILVHDLIVELNKVKHTILQQVVNLQNKTIGFVVSNTKNVTCIVPCYPSSILDKYDIVYITDNIWNTYDNTILFLSNLSKISKKRIPCNPEFKIVDDGLVVGVLTSSNQFLQIINPLPLEDTNKDGLRKINGNDYILGEKNTMIASEEVDEERIKYIKQLNTETALYNSFRNTVRILLNDHKNISIRQAIEEELYKKFTPYKMKMTKIIEFLKHVVDKYVIFLDDYDYNTQNQNKISQSCVNYSQESCSENSPFCVNNKEGTTCQLVLPKKNKNDTIYFIKLADELIRYKKVQTFIFKPKSYISFEPIDYSINDNEIIVLQSVLLSDDYFENIGIDIENGENKNVYPTNTDYDNVSPEMTKKTQYYSNENVIIEGENDYNAHCIPKLETIQSPFWKKVFNQNDSDKNITGQKEQTYIIYKEMVYDDKINCGFTFIIDIINKVNDVSITFDDIRKELILFYMKQDEQTKSKLIDIIIEQGKKTLGDELRRGSIDFKGFVLSNMFYLTTIDFMVLLEKFKVPSIFISNRPLMETKNTDNFYIVYTKGSDENSYVFINIPTFKPEEIPSYRMIIENENNILINLRRLDEDLVKSFLDKMDIGEEYSSSLSLFIQNYKKKPTKYFKRKENLRKIRIIEDDEEPQKPVEEPQKPVEEPQKPVEEPPIVIKVKKSRKIKDVRDVALLKNRTKKVKPLEKLPTPPQPQIDIVQNITMKIPKLKSKPKTRKIRIIEDK